MWRRFPATHISGRDVAHSTQVSCREGSTTPRGLSRHLIQNLNMSNLKQAIKLIKEEIKLLEQNPKPITDRNTYWQALRIANDPSVKRVEVYQSDEAGPLVWAVGVGDFWIEAFKFKEDATNFVAVYLPNKECVIRD